VFSVAPFAVKVLAQLILGERNHTWTRTCLPILE
ncbi:hypothetical protein M514_02899, partial [Trichuris suis]